MDYFMLTLRVINIIGCLLILWWLSVSAFRNWRNWNEKTRMHWWALVGWVFLGFELTIENLIQNNSPGPKTIIQTLVVAWTIRALLLNDELSARSSIPWKKEQDDE